MTAYVTFFIAQFQMLSIYNWGSFYGYLFIFIVCTCSCEGNFLNSRMLAYNFCYEGISQKLSCRCYFNLHSFTVFYILTFSCFILSNRLKVDIQKYQKIFFSTRNSNLKVNMKSKTLNNVIYSQRILSLGVLFSGY